MTSLTSFWKGRLSLVVIGLFTENGGKNTRFLSISSSLFSSFYFFLSQLF